MGQERLVEDLREEIVRGEVLVVVGTGVSIQATGGAECAKWDGLIRNGIEHAAEVGRLTKTAARTLRGRLKKSVEERLDVAQEVSEALRFSARVRSVRAAHLLLGHRCPGLRSI